MLIEKSGYKAEKALPFSTFSQAKQISQIQSMSLLENYTDNNRVIAMVPDVWPTGDDDPDLQEE